MERIAMSQEERDWLDWLKRARDGKMTQRQAAEQMRVSERWVRKLLAQMRREGDGVVVHGLRGQPSNRGIAEALRKRAVEALLDPDWHDFGPTFAGEQLAKRHGIEVSKETVRKWMVAAGLWQSRPRKLKEVHSWGLRRSCYGESRPEDAKEYHLGGIAFGHKRDFKPLQARQQFRDVPLQAVVGRDADGVLHAPLFQRRVLRNQLCRLRP